MGQNIAIGIGGLVIGLLVGALALGPVLNDPAPALPVDPGQTGGGISPEDRAELERLQRESISASERLRNEMEATRLARAERDRLATDRTEFEEAIRDLTTRNAELTAQAEKKGEELDIALTTLDRHGLKPVSAEELAAEVEARIAEARRQGQAIVTRLEEQLSSKAGKVAVLASLRELAALGLDAAPEYYKAFEMVEKLGGPFPGSQKNELDLTFPEYTQLLPTLFSEFALRDTSGVAPAGAKAWAMYSLPWNQGMSTSEKVAILGGFVGGGEPVIDQAAIYNLLQLRSPESVPYLSKAAVNGGISGELRAEAVRGMAQLGEAADWATIESLQNDADPKVAEAARASMGARSPGVDGFLVTAVYDGSASKLAGMQVGDIIVRYNGQVVTDQATLLAARNTVGEEAQVTVVVNRSGNSLSLTIKSGAMGVEGRPVQRR